jgi:hypothetical protein
MHGGTNLGMGQLHYYYHQLPKEANMTFWYTLLILLFIDLCMLEGRI